jgi:hypothetical protein
MAGPDIDPASSKATDTPKISLPSRTYGFPPEAFDWSRLPDFDIDFLPPEHIEAFIQALSAPDPIPQTPDDTSASWSFRLNSPALNRGSPSSDLEITRRATASSLNLHDEDRGSRDTAAAAAAAADVAAPGPAKSPTQPQPPLSRRQSTSSLFITARNDWAPVHEKVLRDKDTSAQSSKGKKKKSKNRARSKDETREGYLYSLLKWPFLLVVLGWILGLSIAYLAIRAYISLYEQFVTWRGQRERLRRAMRATSRYQDWVAAARRMDDFFGNGRWKEEDEFAYYDSKTVKRVLEEMKRCRRRAEKGEEDETEEGRQATEDLKVLIEACVKNNFVGVENPRLYSQTYYGTKNLVQNFIDEGELCWTRRLPFFGWLSIGKAQS